MNISIILCVVIFLASALLFRYAENMLGMSRELLEEAIKQRKEISRLHCKNIESASNIAEFRHINN